MRLTVTRQNEKDESTKCVPLYLIVFFCLCVLCIFVHNLSNSHQSSSPCSSVYINLFRQSLTLDRGRAIDILREMSQPSPVKQILCPQQTLGGYPHSQRGGSREMQDDKVSW